MKRKGEARERILEAGARIVHRQGFQAAGLADILEQAQVPKGSFYFYFKSKEEFGLALIDHYAGLFLSKFSEFSNEADLPYAKRLKRFLWWQSGDFIRAGYRGGCPFGNLALEMADVNEPFREKLKTVFAALKAGLVGLLESAQAAGEVRADLEAGEAADFILNAWEGTLLEMKVSRSPAPRRVFERMVFERLLAA